MKYKCMLKWKCHFDEIFITGCTRSCQNDNFWCSQWWKFHQNENISISLYTCTFDQFSMLGWHRWLKSFHMEDMDLLILYIQHLGCWYPGAVKCQGISTQTGLVLPECFGISTSTIQKSVLFWCPQARPWIGFLFETLPDLNNTAVFM